MKKKTIKSDVNVKYLWKRAHRTVGSDAQTERLSSLLLPVNVLPFSLSFAPKQQLYSNKSNCKSDNC